MSNRKEYLKRWRNRNRILNEIVESEDDRCQHNDISVLEELMDVSSDSSEDSRSSSTVSDQDVSLTDPLSSNEIEDPTNENGEDHSMVANTENEENDMTIQLREWILKNKISRSASNELLTILRDNGHDYLPKCTRTLVNTTRTVLSKKKCGGDFLYLGIANGILRTLEANPSHVIECNTISLNVNVDGLPLFKSSNIQVWPILCMFGKLPPFIVAIFVGSGKPSELGDYLNDFLVEYDKLIESGFRYNDHVFAIEIKAFVCDAPARQFMKGIKSHNGYHACERCVVKGVYESSRMLFLDRYCASRDGDSFRDGLYMGTHQINLTPLIGSGINCIQQFPIDYMHLVCLGVVKRLMLSWKEGSRTCKLSPMQLSQISEKLRTFNGKIPFEFARQPRGLEDLKRWKATEFRQFLQYTGCLVLKDVVSSEVRNHFICLSLAMRILLDENDEIRNEFLDYAKDLLQYFVSNCDNLYGRTFTVYNVHNLIHIWEDSENFKTSLDNISTFPFENYMQTIKKFVRKPQNPLSQIVKRVRELETLAMTETSKKPMYAKISITDKDNWFLLQSGDVAKVQQ